MRIIDLAVKDLKQLIRDWKTALFLVAMPVAFTLLFGFAFAGAWGGDEDPRLPVGYLDYDESVVSGYLLDQLSGSDTLRLVDLAGEGLSVEEAMEQVADGELAAAVVVPAGYGTQALDLASVEEPRLELIADAAGDGGRTALNTVETAATRLMGAAVAARLAARSYEEQGGVASPDFMEQALATAMAAWQDPPLEVNVRASGALALEEEEQGAEVSPFAHSSAGTMVQFAMAGLIGAAEIVLVERKSGALKRMLTTPISRTQILVGHSLAMFAMILFQLLLLIVFGQFVLGVDYFSAPAATSVMVLTTAVWAASLGLLIGVLVRTDEQVIMATIVTMLVLSGLGGAWMPLEFTGETFQTVGRLTPVAWAIDGFENVVMRGLGLESVLLPAAILVGYAVVLFALAGWRFRYE